MHRVCLVIIDGFGVAEASKGNARAQADMPFLAKLEKEVPHCLMEAAGNAVGLPQGQQGASEPGHLTIGAGRVVWQPLAEINRAVESGAFFENVALVHACKRAQEQQVPLHLIGLYSSGGVHSSINHWHAMLQLAKQRKVPQVVLHLFSDGRDVPEQHFCTELSLLEEEISKQQLGVIASLVGRYFAMDRDQQYRDRTKIAYDLLVQGEGEEVDDIRAGVRNFYLHAKDKEKTDYYIRPLKTSAFRTIASRDVVVCINFRSDRMIQIVRALEDEDFSEFPRPIRVHDVTCMGPYSSHLPVAYPPADVRHTLGETVAEAGLSQLRVAETDKFAHVTFFFNAQRTEPYLGEERILVESPKVPNYADTPEMSADDVTRVVCENAVKEHYALIVVNYANPDLVGHGGRLDAAITACETVDRNLSKLLPVLEKHGYEWILTADHGNAECMLLEDGKTANPSHTTNQVQTFVKSSVISQSDLDKTTGLKDIAPMCLKMLRLEVPEEMKN